MDFGEIHYDAWQSLQDAERQACQGRNRSRLADKERLIQGFACNLFTRFIQIDVDPRSGSATAPSRARFPRGLSTWDQSKYQLHCHNDCITMPLANMEWWSGKYKMLCMSFVSS
jgi:hypothetical protein